VRLRIRIRRLQRCRMGPTGDSKMKLGSVGFRDLVRIPRCVLPASADPVLPASADPVLPASADPGKSGLPLRELVGHINLDSGVRLVGLRKRDKSTPTDWYFRFCLIFEPILTESARTALNSNRLRREVFRSMEGTDPPPLRSPLVRWRNVHWTRAFVRSGFWQQAILTALYSCTRTLFQSKPLANWNAEDARC
jgi:hypothetical protein